MTEAAEANMITDRDELFAYLCRGLDAKLADDIVTMVQKASIARSDTDSPLTIDGSLGTLAMALAMKIALVPATDEVVLNKCVYLSHFIYAQVIAARAVQYAQLEAQDAVRH